MKDFKINAESRVHPNIAIINTGGEILFAADGKKIAAIDRETALGLCSWLMAAASVPPTGSVWDGRDGVESRVTGVVDETVHYERTAKETLSIMEFTMVHG